MRVRQKVKELSEHVFDIGEYDDVLELVKAIEGSKKQRKLAFHTLKRLIPLRPKRPLYYVNFNVGPRWSRSVVEDMGSYLDLLVKELRFEKEGTYYNLPLGANIHHLMGQVNDDLKSILAKVDLYNRIAYVPAKHVYGSPNDTRHYFSDSDVVVLALSAVKLGEELKKESEFVRNLCQDIVLPGQKPLTGQHRRTDAHGLPVNFKQKLNHELSFLKDMLS
jgi:hypothetical protein